MRKCSECGKEIKAGFWSESGDWYCCDGCMDRQVADGRLRESDLAALGMENGYGGFYDEKVGDVWMESDVFWTEWEDEEPEWEDWSGEFGDRGEACYVLHAGSGWYKVACVLWLDGTSPKNWNAFVFSFLAAGPEEAVEMASEAVDANVLVDLGEYGTPEEASAAVRCHVGAGLSREDRAKCDAVIEAFSFELKDCGGVPWYMDVRWEYDVIEAVGKPVVTASLVYSGNVLASGDILVESGEWPGDCYGFTKTLYLVLGAASAAKVLRKL